MKKLLLLVMCCASIFAMGCRHSTIHYKNGSKLRARVLDADTEHVYVLTPQKTILTVERSTIARHRPPGRVTSILGGLQALSTLYLFATLRDDLDPAARGLFLGIITGSAATSLLGIAIRRDAEARYNHGIGSASVRPARVRLEPVLSTGSNRTLAGFRLRF